MRNLDELLQKRETLLIEWQNRWDIDELRRQTGHRPFYVSYQTICLQEELIRVNYEINYKMSV